MQNPVIFFFFFFAALAGRYVHFYTIITSKNRSLQIIFQNTDCMCLSCSFKLSVMLDYLIGSCKLVSKLKYYHFGRLLGYRCVVFICICTEQCISIQSIPLSQSVFLQLIQGLCFFGGV